MTRTAACPALRRRRQLRSASTPQTATADAPTTAVPHVTAAAPPRAATAAISALHTWQRPLVQRISALPHLLAAVATLIGGTAYSGEQARQCFTFRTHIVTPRATQCESRRGTARCLASAGLSPGLTVYHFAGLLQAASPAKANPRPADHIAGRPSCRLPTSAACTNTASRLSLEIVPSPTGPINYHIKMSQLRFWPLQGQTTYLRFSVRAAGLKLCPHTPTSFLGPAGRCMLQQAPPQRPTAPSVQLVYTWACLAYANSLSPSWAITPHWGITRKFNQKPLKTAQPPHSHYQTDV